MYTGNPRLDAMLKETDTKLEDWLHEHRFYLENVSKPMAGIGEITDLRQLECLYELRTFGGEVVLTLRDYSYFAALSFSKRFIEDIPNELATLAGVFREAIGDEKRKVANEYEKKVKLLVTTCKWDKMPPPEHQLPQNWMPFEFYDYWESRVAKQPDNVTMSQ